MSEIRVAFPSFNSNTITAVGLIVGLLSQSAGIVWWGATVNSRLAAVEQKLVGSDDVAVLLARMDERTSGLLTTVNRIDARQNAQDAARLSRKP